MGIIRTFLVNSSAYLLAQLAGRAITLVFFAYVARLLSLEELGQFAILNILATVLAIVMTLGLQSAFNRYYFEVPPQRRLEFQRAIVTVLLAVNLVAGGLLLVAKPFLEMASVPMGLGLLTVILWLPVTRSLAEIALVRLRLENRIFQVVTLTLAQVGVYVAASLALLGLGMDRMLALFVGMLAQNLVGTLWCAAQVGVWRPRLDLALIAPSVRFSLFLLPTSLGAYMSMFTGKYLLGKFESLAQVGVYEASQRTAMAAYLFMEPLRTATWPLVFEKYKQEGFARQWNFLVWIHLMALAGLVIGFSVFSREVVLVIVGAKYLPYSYMLFPLVLVAAFQHISALGSLNIYLAHKPQYDSFIEIGSGLFNLAISLALIAPYGIHGALLAAVITYALRCGLHVSVGNRLYPALRLSRRLLAAAGGLCVILLGMHYLLAEIYLPVRAGLCAAELTAVVALAARCNGIRLRQLPKVAGQVLGLSRPTAQPPGP